MDRLFRYILYAALCFFSSDFTLAQEYVDFDRLMRDYGLVDILTLDDEILVDLRYSGNDNFIGEDMYGELDKAYFEKEFANRVVAAQQELHRRRPDLTLLVYDAARPLSVQLRMH